MNGLRKFTLHQSDLTGATTMLEAVAPTARGGDDRSAMDPESAARAYLESALDNPSVPTLEASVVGGAPAEFKSLGTESIPITQTKTVKFRQHYRKIPVYGSIVTVELDDKNDLISLNSSLGDPNNVDPQAALSPKQVIDIIRNDAGYGNHHLDAVARLFYYFEATSLRWHLAYIVEDVLIRADTVVSTDNKSALPETFDYVIDAVHGEIIDKLPRTQTMARIPDSVTADDEQSTPRTFGVIANTDSGRHEMEDAVRNIHTHDFQFQDTYFNQNALPGPYVNNPPNPWDSAAVSAHANAAEVAEFLQIVLRRDGLDGQGSPIISSINCVYQSPAGSTEWHNAARFRGQMIYGQRRVGGQLVSYAVAKDIVAHELMHGLTEHTARLEYRFEMGAMNESYSDIFGIIISNYPNEDISQWNWQMGEDLDDTGLPLRDFQDPTLTGHPAHMDHYLHLTEQEDYGGVHINSGIHNKAAYNVLSAVDTNGVLLFNPFTVAQLFYLAISQDLSRTSGFSDSRRGVEKWTKTLFRNDPRRDLYVEAVASAFGNVGINP